MHDRVLSVVLEWLTQTLNNAQAYSSLRYGIRHFDYL